MACPPLTWRRGQLGLRTSAAGAGHPSAPCGLRPVGRPGRTGRAGEGPDLL